MLFGDIAMKKVFKQSLICILSVMLSVTMFPVYAFAEGGADPADTAEVMEAEFPEEFYSEEEPLDNDELFTLYAESVLYGDAENEAPLLRGRNIVPGGLNGIIYSKLKEDVALVANGTNNSTAFELSLADLGLAGKTWTAKDLGVDAIVANGAISQEAVRALQASLGVDLNVIMGALLADCPYELYWYDKTVGVTMSGPRIGASYSGSEYVMTLNSGYIFSLAVAQGYSAGEYLVDTSGIERVHHAVDTAASIVNDASSENDYNKLYAYKDAICSRVSYNYDAAYDDSTPYGDPWQLISVFDDDTDTNIVCEGYSKAFQYLCDRTAFDGDINCISVSGYMGGGTGAGAHMWNIVTMEDGRNYLVDVTNCDDGTIGAPDQLFLAGYDSGSKDAGYVFNAGGTEISYTYGNDTLNLYDSELEIAGSDYEYHEWSEWIEVTPATCTEGGLEKRTCSICGEEQTRVTEALGHDYVVAADTAVDPTCSEAGHEDNQVCTRCGDTIYGAEIAPLGHELTKVDAKEATETEEGNIEYWVCETCGKYFADSEGTAEISAESVVVPMVVPVVIASGSCGDDSTFVLYEDGDFIVSGTGRISDFSLYDSYRNSIKNMVIEEGIEEIASYAFVNCKNLESVTIPQSLNIIEMDIFEGCNNLKRVDISDISKYVQIGNWGYFSPATCYGADLYLNGELVTDVVIPYDVEYVGSYAFCNCNSITSVTISEGVTSIGNDTFTFCTNLKKIIIPDSLTYIGFEAFFGCSSLESILIPESVTEIANVGVFGGCDKLNDIYVIKDSIADTWLAENGLSDKVKYVTKEDEHYCIEEVISEPDCGHAGKVKYTCVICSEEKTVEIPATGDHTWDEGEITIPATCMENGLKTFTCTVCGETKTEEIFALGHNYIDGVCTRCGEKEILISGSCGDNAKFDLYADGEFVVSGTGEMSDFSEYDFYKDKIKTVIIKSGITGIGEYAFNYCTNLTSTTIYEGVTIIGSYAFYDCYSLTSIEIPKSVTSIGEWAFYCCNSLKSITIPVNVVSIGESAFRDCSSLTSIVIPKDVETIGSFAFYDCNSLKSITLPFTGESKFDRKNNTHFGYIFGASSYYYNNDYVPVSLKKVVINGDITSIPEHAFYECYNLTSITIPEGVTSIENSAFSVCGRLTDIKLPDGLLSIGDSAFAECGYLSKIVIPDSVKYIKGNTFDKAGLKEILIPESVIQLSSTAFWGCTGLKTFYVVKGSYADGKCFALNDDGEDIGAVTKYVYKSGKHYVYDKITKKATLSEDGKIVPECVICGEKLSEKTISHPKTFKLSATSYTYDGNVKRPTVTVTDAEGKTITSSNYTVTYGSGRKNIGTYKVTITMGGDKYSGKKEMTFKIRANLANTASKVTVSGITTKAYTGSAIKPVPTVKAIGTSGTVVTLKKDTDYTLSYSNNTKIGTATITITGKGNYSGTKTLTFMIKGSLANTATKVSVSSVADKTYTGSLIKPAPTVKAIGTSGSIVTLKNGTDYTLTYSANKNVGKATITITGKGNYSGTKTVTFKINPKGTTLKTLAATSKGFKVTWTKQATKMSTSYITGYQIQYSTSSTFASGNTTVTATNYSTVSKTISNLTAKKKYYVRIRTYKTVSGVKYYSPWSEKKYVTTKA